MNNDSSRLEDLKVQIEDIIQRLHELENKYDSEVSQVNPVYKKSALNLVHYLAFRSFNIADIQEELRDLGLPSLSNIEPHVMRSLNSIQKIILKLLDKPTPKKEKRAVSVKKSKKILNRNTKFLFGYKSKKRRTRIMVTLPNTAAEDYGFVHGLIKSGMNSARINCAHDDPETWKRMIENVKEASKNLHKNCKIMMDLGGPKIRTGQMVPGAEVIHIKPQRDEYGKVVTPAKIWIAPPDILPPDNSADAILPVDEQWFSKIKRGSIITFKDSRDKKCKITVEKKRGGGKWGYCNDSAYVATGTQLTLHRTKKGTEVLRVGTLLPLETFIVLKVGDRLILTRMQNLTLKVN